MADNQQNQPNFVIQKVFTKDISLESPSAPGIFKDDLSPKPNLNVDTQSHSIDQNSYRVDLNITLTVKTQEQTAYLIEMTQSGIFTLENMPEDQIKPLLGAYCPTTLFPYAKETIDNLINRAGFPPINLAPINFDALYMQNQDQQEQDQPTKH